MQKAYFSSCLGARQHSSFPHVRLPLRAVSPMKAIRLGAFSARTTFVQPHSSFSQPNELLRDSVVREYDALRSTIYNMSLLEIRNAPQSGPSFRGLIRSLRAALTLPNTFCAAKRAKQCQFFRALSMQRFLASSQHSMHEIDSHLSVAGTSPQAILCCWPPTLRQNLVKLCRCLTVRITILVH